MPQGAFQISWKPPTRERSDRGGRRVSPLPRCGAFLFFNVELCVLVRTSEGIFTYFYTLFLCLIEYWVLIVIYIVKKKKKKEKKKKKKNPSLFLEISGNPYISRNVAETWTVPPGRYVRGCTVIFIENVHGWRRLQTHTHTNRQYTQTTNLYYFPHRFPFSSHT